MNQLKKIFLNALLLTIALFLLIILPKISRISAQENPDSMAPKYSITFPIPELGGCQNYSDCRAFCEDPLNYTTCIDFAKKKGFYKEESLQNNQQTILNAAKTQLGCDSYDSCRDFCSQEANLDKCTSFARTNNLQGGQTSDPAKTQKTSLTLVSGENHLLIKTVHAGDQGSLVCRLGDGAVTAHP